MNGNSVPLGPSQQSILIFKTAELPGPFALSYYFSNKRKNKRKEKERKKREKKEKRKKGIKKEK